MNPCAEQALDCLANLFHSGDGADFEVHNGETVIRCHKGFLAQHTGSFFGAALSGNYFRESNQDYIDMTRQGFDDEVLRASVAFLYGIKYNAQCSQTSDPAMFNAKCFAAGEFLGMKDFQDYALSNFRTLAALDEDLDIDLRHLKQQLDDPEQDGSEAEDSDFELESEGSDEECSQSDDSQIDDQEVANVVSGRQTPRPLVRSISPAVLEAHMANMRIVLETAPVVYSTHSSVRGMRDALVTMILLWYTELFADDLVEHTRRVLEETPALAVDLQVKTASYNSNMLNCDSIWLCTNCERVVGLDATSADVDVDEDLLYCPHCGTDTLQGVKGVASS